MTHSLETVSAVHRGALQSPTPVQPIHCSLCQHNSGTASRWLKLRSASVRPHIVSVVELVSDHWAPCCITNVLAYGHCSPTTLVSIVFPRLVIVSHPLFCVNLCFVIRRQSLFYSSVWFFSYLLLCLFIFCKLGYIFFLLKMDCVISKY